MGPFLQHPGADRQWETRPRLGKTFQGLQAECQVPASFILPNSLRLSRWLPSSLKSFQKALSHGDTLSQRNPRQAASCWTGMVVPAS